MSERWPGGIINKTAPVPTGPYATGTAPGVWTLDQQAYWQQQGLWPTAGLFPNYIEDVFSTYLYTGNGSTQTITNGIDLASKGGMVWKKQRNGTGYNNIQDTVQGKQWALVTSGAFAQQYWNTDGGIQSFNTNGFTVKDDSAGDYGSNGNTFPYVSWTFRKQPKFFDIVTYTGTGSARTVSHNLGSTPGMIIVKSTTNSRNWAVYHKDVGNTSAMYLNGTFAAFASDPIYWNNTSPTSTNFTVNNWVANNESGQTYVAYLFADNAGGFGTTGTDNVISCGSLTFASGINTVNLGYEPQWVMFKNATTGGGNWQMIDNMRGWSQTGYSRLFPNTSDAEGAVASPYIAITSTGFTMNSAVYGTGDTYIYIAIRRPMKVPTDATTVFKPVLDASAAGTPITTGFTVDTQFITNVDNTAYINTTVVDRLRGVSTNTTGKSTYLVTSHTDAEQNGSSQQTLFWDNTGYQHSAYFDSVNTGYLNFARRPGFFDEVCYTGTGTAGQTYNHNLGVVPELMIMKKRSTTGIWCVYNQFSGNALYMQLNSTIPASDDGGTLWNSTTPTSSVFTIGNGSNINASGSTFVAYLFATCAGVSKVGSYTGTGATQAINCGFTGGARFVLIKRTDSTSDWYVWDTARGMVSGTDPSLSLNTTAAEVNANSVYTATTGFSLLASPSADVNTSGASYIFLAIA